MTLGCRFAFAALLAASSAVAAQEQDDGAAGSTASPRWSVTITPYLWAAGLDGNTAASGVGSEIDTGYSFLSLDNLDLTLAANLEARKGGWTVLVDGLYVEFSDAFDRPTVDADAELTGRIFEFSATYPAALIEGLELVFGVRYVALDSTVQIRPGPVGSAGESWLDPLVGARFKHDFSDRWSVSLRGDVGGFGVASELTTNLSATFGYRMTDAMTLRFGYRALQMDFEDGGLVLDAIAQGYAVGVSFAL
jgi:opacity protein-like surface antigen